MSTMPQIEHTPIFSSWMFYVVSRNAKQLLGGFHIFPCFRIHSYQACFLFIRRRYIYSYIYIAYIVAKVRVKICDWSTFLCDIFFTSEGIRNPTTEWEAYSVFHQSRQTDPFPKNMEVDEDNTSQY